MTWQNVVWCLCLGLFVRWLIQLGHNPTTMEHSLNLKQLNATNIPTQHTQNIRGQQVLQGNAPFLMNWLSEGQEYDVEVYISTKDNKEFFTPGGRKGQAPVDKKEPIWSLHGMQYSLDHEESNS